MTRFEIGSLVNCRAREWVVLPSDHDDILLLRPLGGGEAEVCGIYLPLEGKHVTEAHFAPPDPAHAGDFVSGALLRDAARLSLRSGAGPFRSLGRLGARPRPYQLVPLIMALRQASVRLLIADDVGIGKTVEAGLIARELIDRGEVRRMTVLCPPHLCDQWQRELAEKFSLEAVVVRSSTVTSLERALPRSDASLFEHYPFTIASIDYLKSDRRRDSFLRDCPELVIVDEAHTATLASGLGSGQQQRHDLVRDLAKDERRHLLLLTATPHSGIEGAFSSLLGLLVPRFARLEMERLGNEERIELAQYFVQRRRADVQRWIGVDDVTPFPERETAEVTYSLPKNSEYRRLFDDVYAFTRGIVSERLGFGARAQVRQRARYWAALALLRCVMSSPAAAEKALSVRAEAAVDAQDLEQDAAFADALFSPAVADAADQEHAQDQEPTQLVAELAADRAPGTEDSKAGSVDQSVLKRYAARAKGLAGANDPKLVKLSEVLTRLLRDGFNPIVYCRYIATAIYLGEQLATRLKEKGLRVMSITGEQSEEEREALIAELERSPRRLLVATDCLSEGINLQHAFDAVIHYDLPWNPNRLEQREGRVDRYGQRAPTVRTVLLYGQDNPMDEAVMKVLLRKAVSIHKSLGITVPLPVDSGTVVEALIASLFQPAVQMELFDAEQQALLEAQARAKELEHQWEFAIEREKKSRTRFAQHAIDPTRVAQELEESDAVLGDPTTVERFVRRACERLGAPLQAAGTDTFSLPLSPLPQPVQERMSHLADGKSGLIRLSFASPAPVGVESVGRNHPLTAALADYLLETALTPGDGAPSAARCSVVKTKRVQKRTVLLLLRVRMLIERTKSATPGLAEELVVCGYSGKPSNDAWLDDTLALELLEHALPDANVAADERTFAVERALEQIAATPERLNALANARAEVLRAAHQRVRTATGGGRVSVRAHTPPDVLGVYVLLPLM
jgi:superfamily II DNA or RNA helicase